MSLVNFAPDSPIGGNNGSHNQKIVSNGNGIFLTYTYYRGPESTSQIGWALLQSTDGGASFSVRYQQYTHFGTNTPTLESYPRDYIFAVDSDFNHHSDSSGNADAYFYRFDATTGFTTPSVMATIPGGSAVKFSTRLDPTNDLIYYYAWYHGESPQFYALDGNGTIVSETALTREGGWVNDPNGGVTTTVAHYPYVTSDPWGRIFAAWTTAATSGLYWYRDIHFMMASGGYWQRADGTAHSLPVWPDNYGNTDKVSSDDEYYMQNWLSSML